MTAIIIYTKEYVGECEFAYKVVVQVGGTSSTFALEGTYDMTPNDIYRMLTHFNDKYKKEGMIKDLKRSGDCVDGIFVVVEKTPPSPDIEMEHDKMLIQPDMPEDLIDRMLKKSLYEYRIEKILTQDTNMKGWKFESDKAMYMTEIEWEKYLNHFTKEGKEAGLDFTFKLSTVDHGCVN